MSTVNPAISALFGSDTTPTSGIRAAKSVSEDTQNRFLSLLVAQMKNQDPLNPMDNAQLTTQLAQISTVNGVEQLNATMKGMAGGFDGMQTTQAASLAGRQVITSGSSLVLDNGAAAGAFQLDVPVEDITVSILDAAGATVQRVKLGAQREGIHVFQWDGKMDSGADAPGGAYTFRLTAEAGGQTLPAKSLTVGRVEGVSRAATGVVLTVGGVGNVNLSDVMRIM